MHAMLSQVSVAHSHAHSCTNIKKHLVLPVQTSNCSSNWEFRGVLFFSNDEDFVCIIDRLAGGIDYFEKVVGGIKIQTDNLV